MHPTPQLLETPGEKYALVIGINNYRDPGIPPLRYAVNDAIAMRDFLLHPEMGGFKKEHVHVLLNEEATVGDIRSQLLYWLGAKVVESDQVWLFFAGYGNTDYTPAVQQEQPYVNYLLVHDSYQNDLATTAISIPQLREWLDLMANTPVVLFLDCGFSPIGKGRTLPSHKSPALDDYAFLPMLTRDRPRALLIAAGPGEIPLEDEEAELGLFSRLLLQRLRAAAMAGGDQMTLDELQQYLAYEVMCQAESRAAVQRPVKLGNIITPLALLHEHHEPVTVPEGTEELTAAEKVDLLLREAQKEVDADNLYRARDLLQEILEIDGSNRRALSGLQKIEEAVRLNEREGKIKELFTEARKFVDDKDYTAALRSYSHILELDPTSESARLGIESCQALLQKHTTLETDNGAQARAAHRKPAHALRIKAYDQFIWPFIGWWVLLGSIWGLFGARIENETSASVFVTVVKYGALGALIGLVHGTIAFIIKHVEARVRANRLRRSQ